MSVWQRWRAHRRAEPGDESNSDPSQHAADPSVEEAHRFGHALAGERGVASIHGARSLQSRATGVLAVGLMGVIALGFLGWYYTQVFARHSQSQDTSSTQGKTQGEMALPPLGRVDPPVVERVLGPEPDPPSTSLDVGNPLADEPYDPSTSYANTRSSTPEEKATDRRLSGPVFVEASSARARDASPMSDVPVGQRSAVSEHAERDSNGNTLGQLLQPTSTATVQAKVLPTQRLLLPKGAFLDCTLETAIDSSLPGMTTCVMATDAFSADGSVVLLERGTKLVGETRGEVRPGSARVFVLWTEARTPEGVVVPLASPGTDELGRSGLPGEVDRHFWERFGAAILVSVIDGAVQAAVQRSSGGEGAVIVNPSTSRDVMTEILRGTINLPPTVTKQQGDRIAVLVARDLDFRNVYELRHATGRR
jgi:type IV secretion system protein VirB10